MDLGATFFALGISLGLGLLVGLQRERTASNIAGVRTFPLITLLGTISAILAGEFGGWIVGAGLLGDAAAMVIGNLYVLKKAQEEPGITTEMAILVMYAIGALVWVGPASVAVVLGGVVALLLYAKPLLHGFTKRLGERDVRALMQFVLISLVILPVLPNETYGPPPLNALNPRNIWLMVVLVVGLSFGGYALARWVGPRAGTALGGLLGGLVSSTATTVALARRSADSAAFAPAAALGIVLASSVVYGRVLVEIAAAARAQFWNIAPPILALMGVAVVTAIAVWLVVRRSDSILPEPDNPTELRSALLFGALYAGVLLASAAAHQWVGDAGMYAVAAISGLTDMDAITLSSARMVSEGALDPSRAWRAIIIATLANQVFKFGIVATIGTRRLTTICAIVFLAKIIAGVAILMFWPDQAAPIV